MTRPSIRPPGRRRQFGVFDIAEDENRVEDDAKKLVRRFESSGSETSSAIDKYEFLRCFAHDSASEKKESLSRVINIEASTEDVTQEKGQTSILSDASTCCIDQQYLKLEFNPGRGACEQGIFGVASHSQSNLLNNRKQRVIVIKDDGCEKRGTVLLKAGGTASDTDGYGTRSPIGVVSDDYHGSTGTHSSNSTSSISYNKVSSREEDSDGASGAHEIDVENFSVRIFPDLMIFGDMYCTNPKLTFTGGNLKVEGLTVNATKETFTCQWTVEDIIKIESEWSLEVETALINFVIKSGNSKEAGRVNVKSGINLLKFAVYDPDWYVALEAIKSLHSRYKDIWFDISSVNGESNDNAFGGQSSATLFANFTESFEDVIYPQGDPDAILISKRDVEFLRPRSFVNDTIIDFYIRYLKDRIHQKEQCRFHFFNCFFFRKLANIDKGSHSTSGGKEAFERVQKWTKKVDLFRKDYIFIPVNCSLHWSLIVICHPGEAVHYNDDEAQNSQRVPCILHMDSIKGSHRGLKSIFPSYLTEEWKARHGDKTNDSSRILNLQFIPLEVPQQENLYDCGLFLLHYLELFLRQAPVDFSPSIISKSASFLSKNWFLPAEASSKREYIRELLYSLQKDQTQTILSINCKSAHTSSALLNIADQEQEEETEVKKEICNPRKQSDGHSSVATLNLQDLILVKEKLCKGFHDLKTSMRQRICMSPIKEVCEIGDNGTHSPLDRTSRNEECVLYIEDSDKEDTNSITSISESQESSRVELNKDAIIIRSPSTPIETLSDCVVEDSLELHDADNESNQSLDSASSVNTVVVSSEERGSGGTLCVKERGSVLAGSHTLVSQTVAKKVTKRRKPNM